jgi:pimeloyl-ACP methyl ester carboxylesterase
MIAPDVRAHGASTVVGEPADFALDRLADEVAAEVRDVLTAGGGDAEASAPLAILGISMGAAIALRIALRGLLPVERAVFVRPAFDDASLPDNLRPFPVIGQLLADLGPEGGAERFRETEPYHRVAEASPAGGRGLLTQFTAPDAARRARRLVEIPRNRAFTGDAELAGLGARGIRSLVVGARRDPVHPLELAERWAAAIGAPLEVVPPRDDGLAAQTAMLRDRVERWLAAG